MELTLIQKVVIWVVPILSAITMHEVAHGWVASFFGDQTARLSGRLSFNPLKHVDFVGTLVVPLLMLLVSNFIFGWAKPVPVDARNMRYPRRGMACVALAGPLSNFFMALCWGGIAKVALLVTQGGHDWIGTPLYYMGQAGIMINVVLAVLNIIPLPPLDGGKLLMNILPPRMAYRVSIIEPYSFFILILLLMSGILSSIMSPLVFLLLTGIADLFGV